MCFSSALMLLEPPPAPPAELELWGPSPMPPPAPPPPLRGMLPRDADSEDRTFVLPRGVRFALPALVVLWSELRLFWDIFAWTAHSVASLQPSDAHASMHHACRALCTHSGSTVGPCT